MSSIASSPCPPIFFAQGRARPIPRAGVGSRRPRGAGPGSLIGAPLRAAKRKLAPLGRAGQGASVAGLSLDISMLCRHRRNLAISGAPGRRVDRRKEKRARTHRPAGALRARRPSSRPNCEVRRSFPPPNPSPRPVAREQLSPANRRRIPIRSRPESSTPDPSGRGIVRKCFRLLSRPGGPVRKHRIVCGSSGPPRVFRSTQESKLITGVREYSTGGDCGDLRRQVLGPGVGSTAFATTPSFLSSQAGGHARSSIPVTDTDIVQAARTFRQCDPDRARRSGTSISTTGRSPGAGSDERSAETPGTTWQPPSTQRSAKSAERLAPAIRTGNSDGAPPAVTGGLAYPQLVSPLRSPGTRAPSRRGNISAYRRYVALLSGAQFDASIAGLYSSKASPTWLTKSDADMAVVLGHGRRKGRIGWPAGSSPPASEAAYRHAGPPRRSKRPSASPLQHGRVFPGTMEIVLAGGAGNSTTDDRHSICVAVGQRPAEMPRPGGAPLYILG